MNEPGACLLGGISPNLQLKLADRKDLDEINLVVQAAVDTWPLPARTKRLALPVLHYQPIDFTDHEFLLAVQGTCCVGVAVWGSGNPAAFGLPALLHGLYVDPQYQRVGIGHALQAVVAERAAARGMDGLLVKAERVSQDYFLECGYQRLALDQHALSYPYCFWRGFSSEES